MSNAGEQPAACSAAHCGCSFLIYFLLQNVSFCRHIFLINVSGKLADKNILFPVTTS